MRGRRSRPRRRAGRAAGEANLDLEGAGLELGRQGGDRLEARGDREEVEAAGGWRRAPLRRAEDGAGRGGGRRRRDVGHRDQERIARPGARGRDADRGCLRRTWNGRKRRRHEQGDGGDREDSEVMSSHGRLQAAPFWTGRLPLQEGRSGNQAGPERKPLGPPGRPQESCAGADAPRTVEPIPGHARGEGPGRVARFLDWPEEGIVVAPGSNFLMLALAQAANRILDTVSIVRILRGSRAGDRHAVHVGAPGAGLRASG